MRGMDEIEATLRSANDSFMAGMAANESQTTRRLARLLLDVDEAIYQLSRIMPHPTVDHVVGRLQRAAKEARQ